MNPHNSIEETQSVQKEEIRKVAEEIVHLANLGGTLHVNDIIPDIRELVDRISASVREEALAEGKRIGEERTIESVNKFINEKRAGLKNSIY